MDCPEHYEKEKEREKEKMTRKYFRVPENYSKEDIEKLGKGVKDFYSHLIGEEIANRENFECLEDYMVFMEELAEEDFGVFIIGGDKLKKGKLILIILEDGDETKDLREIVEKVNSDNGL